MRRRNIEISNTFLINTNNWFSLVGVMISMMVPPAFFFPQRSGKCFVLFGRSWWWRHFPLFSYFWLDRRKHPGFMYCFFNHIVYSSSSESESKINDHRFGARSCPCYGHFGGGSAVSLCIADDWSLVSCCTRHQGRPTLDSPLTRSLYITSETVGGEKLWQKKTGVEVTFDV